MPPSPFPCSRSGARGLLRVATMLLVALSPALLAQDVATLFRQNCMSCHTIGGGRLVGPDLKDVTKRRDRQTLVSFVSNPTAALASGDPYILKLKEEARGAIMPQIAGMDPAKAGALLDMIEVESKLSKSQFSGLTIGDQPFTAADVARGRRIFTGNRLLVNGGPACISCHSVNGLTSLGGGQLGPDLTKVYERLQGRKNLAAWFQAPATPTMRPLFMTRTLTNDEIVPLVAFLEDEARAGGQADRSPQFSFVLLGLGGAVAGLLGADVVWRKRFRGVRRFLTRRDR